MKRVRFGILGCSSVAQRRFLPALSGASSASLERIGSRSPEKARAFAAQWKCEKYGSYEDVLQDPNVDAVYISTPPSLHEHWLLEAARAGKHVYCEKPAFGDFDAASRAVALFRKSKLRLMEGYMFRFHPQNRRALALIAEGAVGTPRLFSSEYFYPRPAEGNIRLDASLSGGVFSDSAGYGVAAALDVFRQAPLSVSANSSLDKATGVDRAVTLQLEFPDGGLAQIAAAFDVQYKSSYSVTGTKGRLEVERAYAVDPQRATQLWLETDAGRKAIPIDAADQFRLMIEEFAQALLDPGSSRAVFEDDLLRLHRVMEAARASLERKTPVALEGAR